MFDGTTVSMPDPRKAEMMTKPRWELKRLMRKGVTEI
jgi:hypothetical protein